VTAAERLEELRRNVPGAAGVLVGLVVDNPAQFAAVASGSYVITRGLGRLVRPNTVSGALMTAAASYGLCWWLMGEARRRGVLVFRVRDPITGELMTLEELAERAAAVDGALCDCGRDHAPVPLIDLAAVEREVKRRAAPPG
jgi:hypothetical protein